MNTSKVLLVTHMLLNMHALIDTHTLHVKQLNDLPVLVPQTNTVDELGKSYFSGRAWENGQFS